MEKLKGCEGREAPGRCHKRIQGSRSHSALRQGRGLEGGAKRSEQGGARRTRAAGGAWRAPSVRSGEERKPRSRKPGQSQPESG